MSYLRPIRRNDIWLDQIFSAKAAARGGVIRRNKCDVARKIGLSRLEVEVRRRGFHLVEAGEQILIICDRGDIRIVC